MMMINVINEVFMQEMSHFNFFGFCCHGNHEFAFLSQKSQCTMMMINVDNKLFLPEICKKCHIFYLFLLSVTMVTINLIFIQNNIGAL